MGLNLQGQQVRQQWQENRPKMYADLVAKGTLVATIQAKQDLWAEVMSDCLGRHPRQGGPMDYHQAQEIANPILFLPSEEDVPELPGEPNQSPAETTG